MPRRRALSALLRATWLTAASYKVALALSIGALVVTAVPTYLVSHALQGTMADVIREQGTSFPGFIFVGIVATLWIGAAMTVPAEEVQQAIGAGTMEAMLATRTSFGTIALGLSLQRVALVVIRSIVLLVTAAALGVRFTWQGLPLGAVILLLLVLAHLPFGLLALAGVLRFRQATPLAQGVLLVSSIFGGVYFPAAVIPGPLQQLASLVPLTYGLRAARRVLLLGASLGDVWRDVAIMAAFAVALGAVGLLALRGALRFSLRTGTIAQR